MKSSTPYARTIAAALTLTVGALMFVACGDRTAPAPAPTSDSAQTPEPATKEKFKIAWSIYVGWMPWAYADESGILDRWADKYGIEIETVRMDYIPSVEAYVAGQVDGAVMTNMEALNMPAASGVDSTVLVVGDYSNGNDAILTRNGIDVQGLAGQTINLVELSVSHYLLARALELNGLQESDVELQNTSDADIAPIFLADSAQNVMVTWNPMVMEVEQTPGIDKIFTSAEIPGEIMDLLVINTKTLGENPQLGKALTGAWYEVMELMSKRGPETDAAMEAMAEASGSSLTEFTNQLATTAMFYQPQAAVDFISNAEAREKMDFVRRFCFDHGLLGEGVTSVDAVGIAYPDGTVQGDQGNIKLRFTTEYMQAAADGSL